MFAELNHRLRKNGPGLAGSLLLHLALALAVLSLAFHRVGETATHIERIVAVDLVRYGLDTVSPKSVRPDLPPQVSAPTIPKQQAASPVDAAVSPHGTRPARDALDAKLRALARLEQPRDRPRDADFGSGDVTAGDGTGDVALYSVKDYLRAQVLRRWNLNLERLAGRRLIVRLRIEMKRDGTVLVADIVGEPPDDAQYHDIALGARNAALLSSPIQMPPGDYPARMTFTLALDPRDARR